MKYTPTLSAMISLPFLTQGLAVDLGKRSQSLEKICQDYSIPLQVSSSVFIPSYLPFNDSFDAVNWVNQVSTGVASVPYFSGIKNVTGSYSIGATFCTPKNSNINKKTVIVASHGLGFDRRYWNSEFEAANYSFVDAAINRGYSVFFYDRLGTGTSSKFSGYEAPQASTQVAILKQLTFLIKAGNYIGNIGLPSKVVHIGHSFGSIITHGLISTTPELSDGVILTAIGYNSTALQAQGNFVEAFGFRVATEQDPGRWEGRGNGYLIGTDIFAQAAAFFHDFDRKALWYADSIKQPAAAVEILTSGTVIPKEPPNFTGPVMAIDGQYDIAFAAGNCGLYLEHPATELFSKAKNFKAVCHPGSGHGLNFNYNATGAYTVMFDYLKNNL